MTPVRDICKKRLLRLLQDVWLAEDAELQQVVGTSYCRECSQESGGGDSHFSASARRPVMSSCWTSTAAVCTTCSAEGLASRV